MAALSAMGKFTEFWRVLRDLNPESVRRDVERGFSLALLGSDEAGKDAVRRALQPTYRHVAGEFLVEPNGINDGNRDSALPRADLYVYVIDAEKGLTRPDVSALEHLYLLARPTALVFAGNGCRGNLAELRQVTADLGGLVGSAVAVDPRDSCEAEQLIGRLLLRALPNRRLAMARTLRSLRTDTAESIIGETSRVNAEFALLSNLPANIPVLGTIMGAGADFLVLTKNQAMMVLRLAAIYDQDLAEKWRLASEIAPVVGAAFAWRTIARLMVGTLPTPVAALPKTAIAYAGTFVVGQMARYYFEYGQRPSQQVTKRFAEEAADTWPRLVPSRAG